MRLFTISELAFNNDEVIETPWCAIDPDSTWRVAHRRDIYGFKVTEWRSDRNHIEIDVHCPDTGNEEVAKAIAMATYQTLLDEMVVRQEIVKRTRAEAKADFDNGETHDGWKR